MRLALPCLKKGIEMVKKKRLHDANNILATNTMGYNTPADGKKRGVWEGTPILSHGIPNFKHRQDRRQGHLLKNIYLAPNFLKNGINLWTQHGIK